MPERFPEAAQARPPAVAGTWYPGDAGRLESAVAQMLAAAMPWKHAAAPRALIVPHAGLRFSGPTAAHAYAALESSAFDRIVVLSPNHRSPLRGAAVDPSSSYETPLGRMPTDRAAIQFLAAQRDFTCTTRPFAHEHAIEIQLPFLQIQLPSAALVPVIVGEIDRDSCEEIASALGTLLDERTLFIVSSDFMHFGASFGYVPFENNVPDGIQEYDFLAIHAIEHASFDEFQSVLERTGSTICGRNPLRAFLRLVPQGWAAELLAYTTSGEITGDFSHSVSYAAIAFHSNGPSADLGQNHV